jgi:hypothetical protein
VLAFPVATWWLAGDDGPGVIGANIGAGLVVLFGSQIAAALLVWAVARSIYLGHRLRRPVNGSAN